MKAKVWYKSRTIWANIIVVVVAVGIYLQTQPGVIPEQYAVYFAAFLGALNIVLRFLSDQPVNVPFTGKADSTTRK